MKLVYLVLGLLSLLAVQQGCSENAKYMTPERLDRGLVIILPGIEGESPLNRDIRKGLVNAGVRAAMPIHRWGRPIPLAGPLINQVDIMGNRRAAGKVAQMVRDYRSQYPGRPVFLIGHSGGGGIAVFAAEALAQGVKVDGLVLLSASISSGYDLTAAIENTRCGIANFYSARDVGFLVIGTTLAGNVDGKHGPAAGARGFDQPPADAPAPLRAAYTRLFNLELSDAPMLGAHSATTEAQFVASSVAPWITSANWPPGGMNARGTN